MAVTYYYTPAVYQGAWSTLLSTAKFNDVSVGDTTTFESTAMRINDTTTFTAFNDNGVAQKLTGFQFTYIWSEGVSMNFILEGSADHISWTSIDTNSLTADGIAHTYTKSGLNSTFQYYRLSLTGLDDGSFAFTNKLSDWRFTFSSVNSNFIVF